MSERCNKCKHYLPAEKYCKKHHKPAHSRDHICREYKPKDKKTT